MLAFFLIALRVSLIKELFAFSFAKTVLNACLKDSDDIYCWTEGYKLVKRYAPKSEWKDLPYFDKKFIEKSKRNCDNCKHDRECSLYPIETNIKCKHKECGTVLEFDKFEKGKSK